MRTLALAVFALGLAACDHENKLNGDQNTPGATDTDLVPDGPTPTEPTNPTDWIYTDTQTTQGSGTGNPGSGTGSPGSGTGTPGSGTGTTSTGPTTGTGAGTGTWNPSTTDTTTWDECDWASHVAGFLDPLQTPNDDKVIFCHSSGGTNYVYNDTSVSSCLTHIDHAYDIMPTTICDS